MVKTAVIGASGYIGRHLWSAYRRLQPDCLGTSCSTSNPDWVRFDIRHPDVNSLRLEEQRYQAVIIAAAKPNIAFCEKERNVAHAVNVRGTLELIRQLGRTALQVIFLSSDYVFEGNTGRYEDNSETFPTTEYGRQKAFVEKEIPSLTDNYLILRLSKIYGIQKGDRTILDEIACSLAGGREVRVARDQIFCPTLVSDLVRAITAMQAINLKGVMNVCSPEHWSRYDIALELAKSMHLAVDLVKSVTLHEIPEMLARPLNTSMICSRLANEVGTAFVPLRESIQRIVANWAHTQTGAREPILK